MVERTAIRRLCIVEYIAIFVCSCAAPQYDSSINSTIVDLQQKVDLQLNNWISGASDIKYGSEQSPDKTNSKSKSNIQFYDEVDASLRGLSNRILAYRDRSSPPDELFVNISDRIELLKKDHIRLTKSKLDYQQLKENMALVRDELDHTFYKLLEYEAVLKQGAAGSAGGSSSTKTGATSKTN